MDCAQRYVSLSRTAGEDMRFRFGWIPSAVAGSTSATLLNHYSLLGTAEQLLGLPLLGQAASAATMTAAFNL